jgi:hypothetical protein
MTDDRLIVELLDRGEFLLFKSSSETLLTIAADPKRLGFTSVLHTWAAR